MVQKVLLIISFLFIEIQSFKLGLENIPTYVKNDLIKQKTKIGIITNQTGLDQKGKRNIDRLIEEGYHIKTIFVPEHGLTGIYKNGVPINNGIDKKTNIPIISLYKGETSKNTCSKKDLAPLDVLIFDIQDSGMRHYTYISTLFKILKLAAKHNKNVIVLDRPNPLGSIMEGPLVEPDQISFISIAPIPVRHGMTIGELALYFNKYLLPKPAKLKVIPMQGYQRSRGLPKLTAMLSSGLRTKQACYAYSFLGLIGEVRPFFIGLKTNKPFEVLMISTKYTVPPKYWRQLKQLLKKFNVESHPTQVYHKNKLKTYTGLEIKITDINQVHAFQLFLEIIEFFQRRNIKFSFGPTFDLAVGTDKVKSYLNQQLSKQQLKQFINKNLETFHKKAQSCFLYLPAPQIVLLN